MITIGQLADYAGVTIKAVRHYHQRGLLDEPPRDSSGYRRYTAADALTLVKIRTLAEAGVPLARVKDLLTADPDEFTAAIADIDRSLQERAEEIHRTRERLGQLAAGDGLFVSAEVAGYLDRLRDLGVSRRAIHMERDGWILMHSVSPDQASAWIADKLAAIDDPAFQPSTSSTTRHSIGNRTTRAFQPWPNAPSGGSPTGLRIQRTDRRRPWTRPSSSWPRP